MVRPEPRIPYADPSSPTEAKLARLEAHFYHIWQQQGALQEEIKELKRDRAALLKKIGGWVIWVLIVLLSAVVSKGSTPGFLTQQFFETIKSLLL